MRRTLPSLLLLLGLLQPAVAQQFQQEFGNARKPFAEVVALPSHADSRYLPGEQAELRLVAREGGAPLHGVKVYYKAGPEMFLPETPDSATFIDGEARLPMGTLSEPGFLACHYEFLTSDGKKHSDLIKLAFAPEQIQSFTATPHDFTQFWRHALAVARRVPLQPAYTPVTDATDSLVETHLVRLRVGPDKWMRGYLTQPRDGKKHPVVLCPPGAGSQKIHPSDYFARRGMIYLKIEIHDNDPLQPDSLYDIVSKQRCEGYTHRGIERPDTYYYKDVYVGCARAVDFLCSLPGWDGQNVIVTGGSQGGALTIVTAALHERVTMCAPFYPALCDLTAFLHHRAGGWPKFFTASYPVSRIGTTQEQAVSTLRYFDVVCFARLLHVPVFMSWGYSDNTCSPTSVWAAWNAITAPKECHITPSSAHWRFPLSQDRCYEWMLRHLVPTGI